MNTKNFLKKDLIKIVIITLVFSGVLFGLELLDNQGGYVTDLASRITSFFIK